MQQPVSRRDVYRPGLSATVGGRAVDVVSAKVDRALPDPLAGGALAAASVEFSAVEGADVASTVATPWDPASSWPPAPEASVSVSMDAGAGPVSVLTGGRVVSASGGTGGREVSVEAADLYQSLDKTISWDELADLMPSETDGVIGRYVGLQSTAVTDRILRHCGWYATPPMMPSYSMFSVPAVGTMWPERGRVISCSSASAGAYPSWANTSWGVGVQDVDAWYQPLTSYSLQERGRVEMVAMVGPANGEGMRMDLVDGGVSYVRLSWTDAVVAVWMPNSSGVLSSVVTVPREQGMAYATVNRLSDTSVQVILRHGSASASATATVSSASTTTRLSRVWILGAGIGSGFQVAYPSQAGALEGWSPNAVLYPRQAGRNSLRVLPPHAGANCADLLAEQCVAECATYWIDEAGVLRWWDIARLEARGSVATLTSDDDIAESGFTWSHDLSSVKSRVSVKWREPLREGSWRASVDLWQARGQTLTPGETVEDWINVPDDEVWIMPDVAIKRAGSASNEDFNYGLGSWYGAVVEDTDTWAHLSGTLSMTLEQVTGAAFKYAIVWNGAARAIMRTPSPEASTSIWYRRRDFDLPILRGRAKYTLGDRVTYSTQSGPSSAPEHGIDAGWWIQRPDQAQYTADYAGARLTVPQPVLSSVALIPVPGLQLGDMVTVVDGAVTRLTVRGIVIEDSRTIDSGMGVAHSVAIRPVAVSRNGVTWQEWASVTRKTWSQWQSAEGGTWQQWGSNPLNE